MKKYNIAVVGATGNVGREILNILDERNFPVKKLYAIASDKSKGKEIKFGKDKSITVESLNKFNFDLLVSEKIYHLDHIKKVCIDYRLRFLDIKYFKNTLPKQALEEIKRLEQNHKTTLGEFKIMAPSILFRLKKTDDPLLFVPIGNNYFYLVHRLFHTKNFHKTVLKMK